VFERRRCDPYVKCFKDTTSENASSTKLLGLVGYIEDRPRPDWR
jgi:hypothetical protein